ncbi:MAG: SusC/RagA family TonB-linked outer membrane protein [Lewinellaceae bacterium]|nr:SusC/RagA family TonB-linked outer membrane protein [Lewinellaceae bacterium]
MEPAIFTPKKVILRILFAIIPLLSLLPISVLHAQPGTRTISGKVTDESNLPLAYVNIALNNGGLIRGTQTEENGNFSISASAGDTLVFSYVGYDTYRVAVGTENTLNVILHSSGSVLDEVVVVGYGTTTRRDLTTAVAKVDPDKIPLAANNSIPELLFGRAAGLRATLNSSQPGGSIDVSIRGKGTPLLVVDGVIYPNRALEPDNGSVELQGVNRGILAGLNPSDIESIEVLKDASASIYGVSAGNGVLLITTKKGRAGRINVAYDGSRSVVQNMPYLQPLTAEEYMTYFNQLSQDKYLSDKNMEPFGSNPANLNNFHPEYTEEQIASAGKGTDWLDEVLRGGSIDNHALTVSGGTEKVRYFFSGSYFNQLGTMERSSMRRYTGRINLDFDLTRFLSLSTNMALNRNKYVNPQAGWQTGGSGSQGFNALQAALAYPASVPVYDEKGKYSQFALTGNPVSLLNIMDETNAQGIFANLALDLHIIPKVLKARVSYGNNNENALRNFFVPSDVFWFQLYQSRASISEDRRQNQTMEATISFTKKLGEVLKIDAVGGVGRYLEDWSGVNVEASNLPDAINIDGIGQATGARTIGSYRGGQEFRSLFIRSNFDFLDRYVLSLALRRDGADRFFPDNKYENFPSASLGWKLSNESFLRDVKFINLLKIRGSYGLTGERPGELAYGIFSPDVVTITFEDGTVIFVPYILTQLDNPDFKWPINTTANAGLDFEFWDYRISGSFDIFQEDRTRMNIRATTDQLSLLPTTPINGGQQRRTGYEANLNLFPVRTPGFSWNIGVNYTHFKNRWIERFPNDPIPHGGSLEDPIGTIYVYETNGIIGIDQIIPETQPAGAQKPGSPLFVDQNGDGVLDDSDIIRFSSVPDALIGFNNSFRYKNFDLSFFFYGQFGAWGYDYTTLWGDPLNFLGQTQSGTTRIKDVWSTFNTSGTFPGVSYNESTVQGLNAGIDTRLAKRDFLRCRNITLGYTFTSPALTKYVSQLRIFVDVQNAFIITGFKGVDPEIQAAAIKGGPAPYPMARTYSFGVKANF